jgi:mRNA interferase MazF
LSYLGRGTEDRCNFGSKNRCRSRPVGPRGQVPQSKPGAPISREFTQRAREADPTGPRGGKDRSIGREATGRTGFGCPHLARILRGEIHWADLNPVPGREQAGLRPVLILSHDLFNKKSETVIAMAITSQPQKAGFPLTLALPPGMLPKSSWVKISQIRTVSVDRPGRRTAVLDTDSLGQLVDGLLELTG